MFENIPVDILKIINKYRKEMNYCMVCHENKKIKYFYHCDKCLEKMPKKIILNKIIL